MTIKPKFSIADAPKCSATDKRAHLWTPANVLVFALRSLTGSVRKHVALARISLAVLGAAQLINAIFTAGTSVPVPRYAIRSVCGTVAEDPCRGSGCFAGAGDTAPLPLARRLGMPS